MGANALGQSCKQRLVHCKQVHIPCQSVRRTFSLGLPLGHKYTHSKGVFVQTLSSLVYFWGDEKMIKAMWPDSRNDLLTVSGVNYCTHTARTPSFTKTNVRARQMQAHAQGFNLINSSNIWKQNSLVGAFFVFFFHISVCAPCPSSNPSTCLGCRDKFKMRLLQGPFGVKYPLLAEHFSSHLSSLSVANYVAFSPCNTKAYFFKTVKDSFLPP